MSRFYELQPRDGKGELLSFNCLKGKVVLIVNVASKCGFTPQYHELEELYKKYKDRGLAILGFPCNQFGYQEPGSDLQIAQFCQLNYGVTFPIMKKVYVNGPDTDPVYEFLKSQKAGRLGFRGIKWNFEKFLVNREGQVVGRWDSLEKPSSLDPVIQQLLESNYGV
ncbi:peroxiredoxin hyr1 [Zygosaccharomyces mellis]|uniref:Glutathione peroxidase n=1 Tax=Zygosaccharomyces mellis TaxID=42258 RepID=A0A4C2E6E2_9SACH|nr:peroxiredoxin hyr1 [Zygosaccharomyces mellis]